MIKFNTHCGIYTANIVNQPTIARVRLDLKMKCESSNQPQTSVATVPAMVEMKAASVRPRTVKYSVR